MFKFIPKNVGHLDQIIRFGINAGMIYVGFINEKLIQDDFSAILLGVIGVVLMYPVITRSCPMYILMGWSTCSKENINNSD
ncbi:MAG: DUF2892 domain-containing protein [Methylococcaceae bacterium]